jgi:hypothetical protein
MKFKKYYVIIKKMDENDFWRQAEAAMAVLNINEDEEPKPKQKYNREWAQQYYKQNKDIISARSRAYYQAHKEKMKKANYEYMFKKITCECGTQMIYGSKYRHMKSNIHFKNLKKLLENKDDRCADTIS